jgi:hypothetical protein
MFQSPGFNNFRAPGGGSDVSSQKHLQIVSLHFGTHSCLEAAVTTQRKATLNGHGHGLDVTFE